MVGPLPQAHPQFRFLLVATDYFTKWIKVVLLFEVTGRQVVKFLWQKKCLFDLLHTIISDNGTNFTIKEVATLCANYEIAQRFFTPCYLQALF